MSTQQDIYAAGSESRPLMLNKENYVPWSSRLLRYAKSRPNGKLIYNSILNGPYVRKMIPEPGDANRDITNILLGLPEDIYAAVDSCETAQEIWLRVQQMMKGFDIGIQEKTAKLFNKWESQSGVDMSLLFIKPRICTLLITLNSPHQDQSSFNQNYLQQPMPNPEDITDPTTVMNMALALMAKVFKQNYSTPTNNNQRISSNPRNRQIAQPGMNMGQDRQMLLIGGYSECCSESKGSEWFNWCSREWKSESDWEYGSVRGVSGLQESGLWKWGELAGKREEMNRSLPSLAGKGFTLCDSIQEVRGSSPSLARWVPSADTWRRRLSNDSLPHGSDSNNSSFQVRGGSFDMAGTRLQTCQSEVAEWQGGWPTRGRHVYSMMKYAEVYESKIKSQSSSSLNFHNVAFVYSDNTSNTNETVNTAHGVSAASSKDQASTGSYVNDVMFSFFSNQSNALHLDNKDLEQIDTDDLEEIDLKWQVVMLTMRVKRFIKKTGRKLDLNGKDTISFDSTKVECYNFHRRGHFAREYREPKNQGNRNRDAPTRNAPVETITTNVLVIQDGISGNAKGGEITGKGKIRTGKLDFEDVYFVNELKFNLFSVSQMCDKKINVLFTNTECVVLSPDFKLLDESQVLLKATLDESNLWHRRLGHINFKTMNKLVRGNLARGLPSKIFENDHTCVACQKRKQHKSLCTKANSDARQAGKKIVPGPQYEEKEHKGMNLKVCMDKTSMLMEIRYSLMLVLLDPLMFILNTRIFSGAYDDEFEGAEVDFNDLELTTVVCPIPTTRIHKDYPKEQIIEDPLSALQTRRMTKTSQEHVMVTYIKSWIEAMQDELLQFKLQKVWGLVDLPKGKHAIGTKWVYKNKKNERLIVVRNKARLVAQGYTQEEGINYDEVFAHVARIEAIRLFLAYASFMGFIVYQMDVKSTFLYGIIEEEVYVCQPPGFEDPYFPNKDKGDILLVQMYVDDIIFGSTKKSLCIEFEGLMHKKFHMSSMRELTFFLGLQVMHKDDGIFISQDKYVADILKKFDFSSVKTASTLIETNKALLKDKEAEDVDVYLYKSMIGSLMYLTASRPDIIFVVCAYARFQVTPKISHLHAVQRIFRYLKCQPKLVLRYPRDSPFDLEAF
uniref:Uncharacterized protein n=1 Tax=Tanacetum cinerariifolium TaxID=118510 RepID=A0A6L2P1M7_TANCI|nr:hypothetical protein [Tanacetum cinerariifolium]